MANNQLDRDDGVDLIITSAKNFSIEILLAKDSHIQSAHSKAALRTLSLLSTHQSEIQRGHEEC